MPKATLEFQLPEEQAEYEMAVRGSAAWVALCALWDRLRDRLKHEDDSMTPEAVRELEAIKTLVGALLDGVGIGW